MKKLFIFLLSALAVTAFAQQKKVAVYVTGEQSGVSKVLGDKLVTAFAQSGKYTAVERTSSFLAQLSKEQGYQQSGAVNDNEIARLGMQLGVNYVCVADMSEAFGEKYIFARLIDVETAEIVNTYNVSGEMTNMNACLRMTKEIAENLSKGTFAEQEAEERARKDAERERLEGIQRQGYVDLGLPSGTWWKDENESDYYKYKQAFAKYKNMPTRKQWEELINLCQWNWLGNGFEITGPNGASIILPAEGYYDERNYNSNTHSHIWYITCGRYWSSSRCKECGGDDDYFTPWQLFFSSSGEIHIEAMQPGYGFKVRLVMVP